MSRPRVAQHIATGDEFAAYLDPEGIWIADPADPGYISNSDRLPRGWRWTA